MFFAKPVVEGQGYKVIFCLYEIALRLRYAPLRAKVIFLKQNQLSARKEALRFIPTSLRAFDSQGSG